jgi:hypothetical protein
VVGGAATGCTTTGDVLTLAGTFVLPTDGTARVTYTAPSASNALQNETAVNATANSANFAATQNLTGVTPVPTPFMVSAVVASGGATLAITYNEAVSCAATGAVLSDFAYDSTTATNGINHVIAGCSMVEATDTLTLTGASGTFTTPGVGASITYTAPVLSSASNAVWATGAPTDFALTQTLAGGVS